jgi:hypothetical protein
VVGLQSMQETADALIVLESFGNCSLQRLRLGIFHEQHARVRTVMSVASPRGPPPLGLTHRVRQMTDHRFDIFPGDASGA